jgi:DNA-binding PadR family transcriptional regulator
MVMESNSLKAVRRPQDFLPLTPLSFLVLMVLADRDSHGYGIIKEVERRTEGSSSPGTGTLYTALQRLMDDGLIQEAERRPDIGDDSRRRYYSLTALGRETAQLEAERMASLVGLAIDSDLLPHTAGSSRGDL